MSIGGTNPMNLTGTPMDLSGDSYEFKINDINNLTLTGNSISPVVVRTLTPQSIYLNKLKIKLIKALGSDCRMCGHRIKLEFAHVKRTSLCGKTGRGKCKRLYDVKNNLSSYILLCKRPCHLKFDKEHSFEHVTYSRYNRKYHYREEDQHD